VYCYFLSPQLEPWPGHIAIEVVLNVCAGERMVVRSYVPPFISDLMQQCWNQDHIERPNFEGIIPALECIEV
jgi:hypothetical protein